MTPHFQLIEDRLEYLRAQLAAEQARANFAEHRTSVLESVCAEAYQLAGAIGAPVKALDNLNAAANGLPIPHPTFLPVVPEDCDEVKALTARLEALTESRIFTLDT